MSAFRKRFILAFGLIAAASCRGSLAPATTQSVSEPPQGLAKLVAGRATETRLARENYTYRQTVTVEEVAPTGGIAGQYREVREVIFSPESGRSERVVGHPQSSLVRLKLTEEDFQDVRNVQPFLFDSEQLWAYETRFKGEEQVDGVDCWVLTVRPRQLLAGQRLFDGTLWVDKSDLSIVRTVGKAVPDIRKFSGEENLFPRFTTLWERVDGNRFPVYTYADDILDFRVGPQRIRLKIRYADYRKFGSQSTVTFEADK